MLGSFPYNHYAIRSFSSARKKIKALQGQPWTSHHLGDLHGTRFAKRISLLSLDLIIIIIISLATIFLLLFFLIIIVNISLWNNEALASFALAHYLEGCYCFRCHRHHREHHHYLQHHNHYSYTIGLS